MTSITKLSNRCKSGPCVHIQYDISDSELALELSSEVLTSTLTGCQTLHTGIYPYHIQCIQHLEPADMCNQLDFFHWININPLMIHNILYTYEAHTR